MSSSNELCFHPNHPDGCPTMVDYLWDSGRHYDDMKDDKAAVAVCGKFLRAHGIEPAAWLIGNELVVRIRCDGSRWLSTWRAVGNESLTTLCENCPSCVKQERMDVPLAAPVPMLPGAWLARKSKTLVMLSERSEVAA